MNILHVMTGSNHEVNKVFVRFLSENYDINNHFILIIDEKKNIPSEIKSYPNLMIYSNNKDIKFFINTFKKYNKIILHSLSLNYNIQYFLLVRPKLFKKIIWIAWGMDLYQWKNEKNGYIKNLILFLFRKNIKNFVGIFPPDIEFFNNKFRPISNTYYCCYPGTLYNPIYTNDYELYNLDYKYDNNLCINIQVGHQCNSILNHEKVLENLKKFKDENIKIYLPLNYGDMEYGNKIMKKAKYIFGDKAIIIKKKMEKTDYMNLLSTIDIAIFNTNRQIGLGNILPLIYLNKKIFIPSNTIMYNFFKSNKVDITDYNLVKDMNFKEFIKAKNGCYGSEFIRSNYMDKIAYRKMWSSVFNIKI